MKKRFSWVSLAVVAFTLSVSICEAKRHGSGHGQRDGTPMQDQREASVAPTFSKDDADLVRAVADRRDVNYVEASNMAITRILADDTQGLPHQRFYVRTSDGKEVFCVSNLDFGRIPLAVGAIVKVGGQFKWTQQGPLMHWLHKDPRKSRPDGYVELGGTVYGK